VTEKPLGHRAAADIPGANKQNVLHYSDKAVKTCGGRPQTSTRKMIGQATTWPKFVDIFQFD
jgi:hypothetical protein